MSPDGECRYTSPVRIVTLGGGPASLYFAILMKKLDPSHEVTVIERNAPDQTFGWGVVFSDETLDYLHENDPETHTEIARAFEHWTAIDVYVRGERVQSGGHGFSGLARKTLLGILQRRAESLGCRLVFNTEVTNPEALARDHDLVVAADGVHSLVRTRYASSFQPTVEEGACRYIWLGTPRRFDAFTFIFEDTPDGILQVHAYPFARDLSTFIVETDEATWKRAGYDALPPDVSVFRLQSLFGKYLNGAPLLTNRSVWTRFPTVRTASWRHENIVLLGDAAHTAHFSIGSGTKLAMEDAIALSRAFAAHTNVPAALAAYDTARRPVVLRTQKAAQDSRQWFEHVERYRDMPPGQFAFSLLSRSKRVTYDNLRKRDRGYVSSVTQDFAARAGVSDLSTPPMFTPFTLRGMTVANRVVVSPMCMYSATDGTVDDFHLVHLGARAQGGAGLVFTEMTDVSPDGRISPGCAGLYAPAHVPAWKRIVDFVHRTTHARIGVQLGHAGRKGSVHIPWEGPGDTALATGGWQTLAPSAIPYGPDSAIPRAMDATDMATVQGQYIRATEMALAAGFDLIELHMAHGYLLSSFLSPLSNHRTDAYGGTVANRLRFPLKIFDAVRAAWPVERPIAVRISATDWADGGLTDDDLRVIAHALKEHGCDVIDVSTGQTSPQCQPVYGRMFQTPWSELVRLEVGIPTITVGNIQDADQVNTILAAGRADLCALARPHLSDPSWTLRAAARQGWEPQPWPPQYLRGRGTAL